MINLDENKQMITKNEKAHLKYRTYAIFQVITNLVLIFFSLSLFLTAYAVFSDNINTKINPQAWEKLLEDAMTFDAHASGSLWTAGFLFYIAVIFYLISIFLGIYLYRLKDNLYDSLFLLFAPIPIFSSIFCLLAQIVTDNNIRMTQPNYKLSKSEIKKIKDNILEELKKDKVITEDVLEELNNDEE